MRDIRGDLKDRAEALEREIKAAQGRFDELIERLKQEHDGRVNELKSELDAVELLIGLEHRLLGNGAPKANGAPQSNGVPQGNGVQAKPQPQAEASRSQAQAQPPRPQQQDMALRKAV
jgi:hypothetical protein